MNVSMRSEHEHGRRSTTDSDRGWLLPLEEAYIYMRHSNAPKHIYISLLSYDWHSCAEVAAATVPLLILLDNYGFLLRWLMALDRVFDGDLDGYSHLYCR